MEIPDSAAALQLERNIYKEKIYEHYPKYPCNRSEFKYPKLTFKKKFKKNFKKFSLIFLGERWLFSVEPMEGSGSEYIIRIRNTIYLSRLSQ